MNKQVSIRIALIGPVSDSPQLGWHWSRSYSAGAGPWQTLDEGAVSQWAASTLESMAERLPFMAPPARYWRGSVVSGGYEVIITPDSDLSWETDSVRLRLSGSYLEAGMAPCSALMPLAAAEAARDENARRLGRLNDQRRALRAQTPA